MSSVSMSDLVSIFAECGSADAAVPLTEAVLDQQFYDLGYDSLLLLQAAELVLARHGVRVPEEVLDLAETPRMLLDLVDSSSRGALV